MQIMVYYIFFFIFQHTDLSLGVSWPYLYLTFGHILICQYEITFIIYIKAINKSPVTMLPAQQWNSKQ